MVGAVLGDCLGSPLEFISNDPLSTKRINQHFVRLRRNEDKIMRYTDDTAMARQVLLLLISA